MLSAYFARFWSPWVTAQKESVLTLATWLIFLARCARILDQEGYPDCKIVVSNALDEFIIKDLLSQNAPIDSFGVGERLITSRSEPVFGGVYKLSGVVRDGVLVPKLKLSENVGKMTTPGL